MSIRLMTLVWDIPFPTSTQMLIALKLADYANDYGTSIFPANETLATKARCSETTVKTTLKVMRDCGILRLTRKGGNGPKDTNEWALNLPLIRALSIGTITIEGCSTVLEIIGDLPVENKGSEFDPLATVRGQSGGLRGQPTDAKGSAHGPQSTNNHQLEPSANNFDLKVQKAKPEIRLTPDDGQRWVEWVNYLSANSPVQAEEALYSKAIFVTSNWPTETAEVLRIPRAAKLTEKSQAMAGGE